MPSRSGARRRSARGTGSRCRCCAPCTGRRARPGACPGTRPTRRRGAAPRRAPARAAAAGCRGARPSPSRWCPGSPGRSAADGSRCCLAGSRSGAASGASRSCRSFRCRLWCSCVKSRTRARAGAPTGRAVPRRVSVDRLELHDQRTVVAARAVHRPQHERAGRLPVARGHHVVDRRAEQRAASSADQVPMPPLPVSAAPSWHSPSVPPSTPEVAHVVDRRVEVARP